MINLDENTFTVINDEGKEVVCDILFTFDYADTKRAILCIQIIAKMKLMDRFRYLPQFSMKPTTVIICCCRSNRKQNGW